MTIYFSYIGEFDDAAFHWQHPENAPTTANLPRRLIPVSPHSDIGISTLRVMQFIREGRYEGKQLDWGAWGIKMTGGELRTFFTEHTETVQRLHGDAIAALDLDKVYVLVAGEGA